MVQKLKKLINKFDAYYLYFFYNINNMVLSLSVVSAIYFVRTAKTNVQKANIMANFLVKRSSIYGIIGGVSAYKTYI